MAVGVDQVRGRAADADEAQQGRVGGQRTVVDAGAAQVEQGEVRAAEGVEEPGGRAVGRGARGVGGPVARGGDALGEVRAQLVRQRAVGVADAELVQVAAAAQLAGAVQPGAGVEDALGDRAALGLVGVEEAVGGAVPQYLAELPAEVVGVLDAGVQALAARGEWMCAASPARKTRPVR